MAVRKSEPGITHVLANCLTCAARWDDYRTADDSARRHAAESGHTVNVECVMVWDYKYAGAKRRPQEG